MYNKKCVSKKKSPIVRIFFFWGIKKKNSKKIYKNIILKNIFINLIKSNLIKIKCNIAISIFVFITN